MLVKSLQLLQYPLKIIIDTCQRCHVDPDMPAGSQVPGYCGAAAWWSSRVACWRLVICRHVVKLEADIADRNVLVAMATCSTCDVIASVTTSEVFECRAGGRPGDDVRGVVGDVISEAHTWPEVWNISFIDIEVILETGFLLSNITEKHKLPYTMFRDRFLSFHMI